MLKKRQKRLLIILAILVALFGFLVWRKNKTKPTIQQLPVTQLIGPQEYTVGSSSINNAQANGIIVATNSAIIMPSMGGIIQSLSCNPGQEIKAGDLIAQLVPAKDLQTENLTLQKDYLGRQAGVLSDALNAGLKNIDIQIVSLQDQKATNEKQLALLQQNVVNLQQQKQLSTNDLSIQRQSLQTQLDNLLAQQKTDTAKTNNTLSTQIQAIQNNANAGLSLVDKMLGISNPESVKYSKIYVGGKDPFGINKIENDYATMQGLINNLDTILPAQASTNIQTIIDYFTLAANAVNKSIVDNRYLPQTQIDALYNAFNGTANGLLQAKTNYDATVAGLDTIGNSYNTQITTLQNQLTSLNDNKGGLSNIAIDTQINGLQSQINSLQLAIESYDNQLAALQNSKNIQTQQTNGQLLTVQQNYQTLKNNLAGETLYSPIDGIVKMSSAVVGNKVGPTSPLCIIGPRSIDGLKIQFSSSQNLPLGKEIIVYIDGKSIGSGTVDAKGTFVDPLTQNYNYEIQHLKYSPIYREGQKVTIFFDTQDTMQTIWIPLYFITPKLDGYYVTEKDSLGTGNHEQNVILGEIHGENIQILSGLTLGDTIIK